MLPNVSPRLKSLLNVLLPIECHRSLYKRKLYKCHGCGCNMYEFHWSKILDKVLEYLISNVQRSQVLNTPCPEVAISVQWHLLYLELGGTEQYFESRFWLRTYFGEIVGWLYNDIHCTCFREKRAGGFPMPCSFDLKINRLISITLHHV